MESEQENLDAGNIEKALELETQPPIEHPIVLQQKRDNEHAGENFDKVADNVAEIADEVDEVKLPQPISEYSNSLGRVPPKPPSVKELVATLPEFKSAPEMTQIASLNYTLESKFYYCGFVYKVNCLGADGNPLFKKTSDRSGDARNDIIQNDGYWSKWWMEMWGSVLHLWRVPDELASFSFTASLSIDRVYLELMIELMNAIKSLHQPLLINFADSVSELFNPQRQFVFENNPAPPIPYNSFFGLSTSCSNLYLFAAASFIQANHWVCAMRLAMWEMKRLNLLFTRKLLRKPTMMITWKDFEMEPFDSINFRGDLRYEGPLQIRLPYSNRWKQFHVVATSKTGQEAYVTNSTGLAAIFGKRESRASDPSKRGTLMFYDSKAAMKKGKLPLFMMNDVQDIYAIWPEDANDEKLQKTSLAKIEGSFILPESSGIPDTSNRSFETFQNGFPQVKNLEGVENVITGLDSRQLPTDLLVLAPSSYALSKWIVATLASFSLDSGNTNLDEEIKEMTKLPEPDEDEIQPELVKVEWPSQLYLSLNEVGGLQVPQTHSETTAFFSHFLEQKMAFSKQGQLKMWSETIAKGEWERGLCDRKEMEYKLSALFGWVDLVAKELVINSISATKPQPMVLVSAMATILPWLGEVLTSMVGVETTEKPKSIASSKTAPSIASGVSAVPTASTDGEGSISEEERSSEGSQSEREESEVSATGLTSPSAGGETASTDPEVQEAGFQVYAPNSLLAQQAAIKLDQKRVQVGPFFTPQVDPKVANPYGENSLLNNRLSVPGDATPRMSLINGISPDENRRTVGAPFAESGLIQKVGASGNNRLSAGGPLLGNDVGSNSHKPKLQDGLLGDLDRRRKEISLIKKGGVITTSDTATEILIPQLSVVVQRMMNQLHHPTLQPSHSLLDSLKGEVSLLYNLLSQYQNQKGSTYRNDRMSMASAPQPFNSQNRLSINPFALPNISWKQTSTAASLSSSGYGKKTGTDSSSVSHSSGSYTSSAGKHTSGTENSSVHLSESSGTDDEDLPLAKSSLGSTESSSSGSEGSESEESSDSVDEDVPLGLVTDGSKIKQYSTSSQRGYPDSSYSQQSASGSLSRRPLVFVSPPSQTGTVSSQQQYQQPGMQYQQFQQQHSQGMQGLPQNQQGIKHQQFYQTGIQSQNPQYQKGMQRISQQRQSQQSFTMMPSRKSKTSGNTTPKNNSSIGSISDSSPASLRPSSVGSLSDSSKAFSPRKPRFDKSRKPRRPKPVADNSSEGSVSDESE